MHSIVPGYMMKQKQKLFRTCSEIGKQFSNWFMILGDRIATTLGPIKSNSPGIGAIIINRIPVIARKGVPPWRRAIVVVTPHDVEEPKRRHVVDNCFV